MVDGCPSSARSLVPDGQQSKQSRPGKRALEVIVRLMKVVLSQTRFYVYDSSFYLFFFQAEDGIRDLTVTGVQTCALPISRVVRRARPAPHRPVARTPDGRGCEPAHTRGHVGESGPQPRGARETRSGPGVRRSFAGQPRAGELARASAVLQQCVGRAPRCHRRLDRKSVV